VPRRGARPALRLVALLGVMTLALAVVGGRLVQLQVVRAADFEDLGARQRLRRVALPAERGTILDRSGVPLAVSVEARAITANPRLVSDPEETARRVGEALGIDPAAILERLASRPEVSFVYLARMVDLAAAQRVLALGLPGIGTEQEIARVYPAGPLAGQVLGFVGVDGVGLAGLEVSLEKVLGGVPGEEVIEQDPRGRPIPQGRNELRPPVRGRDVILTIDRDIQYATERTLARAVTATGARTGTAVVLDPRSGDVLAMASYPPLDPAAFARATPEEVRNRAVQDVYEPGSVNKVITAAAAIEAGVARPEEVLRIPDRLRIADKTFHDLEPHAEWRITYAEALARSSNIGTIQVAARLGRRGLDRALRAFGLGERTGIELPGESPGILPSVDRWYATSMGTIPIGQGIAVTPLQVAQVYAAIANDGMLVRPRIVQAIAGPDGRPVPRPPSPARQVLSAATAAQVRAMLVGVVEDGTGRNARIPGYLVAGKTGTARKPLEDARGYSTDVVTTFAGIVPADRPQFVAVVVLDAPETHLSALTAAPAFAEIARFALGRLRIPPTVPEPAPVRLATLRARP
jgi:cell division protein FtsI (penicillin-binding protein 3)